MSTLTAFVLLVPVPALLFNVLTRLMRALTNRYRWTDADDVAFAELLEDSS